MAYFANGSEGATLDDQCCECILCDEAHEICCPILAVQMTYNYDQVGNDDLRAAMNLLVSKKGECQLKPYLDKFTKEQLIEEQLIEEHERLIAEAMKD
jgi:hypothetical protein